MTKPEFREIENEIEPEEEQDELDLTEPFDPKEIDIVIEQKSLYSLIQRIEHGEIDLNTEFQRESGLWSRTTMSRLIESVLVRFPLPAFYFDASNDEKWLVVDGLQRLWTFKKFIVDGKPGGEGNPLRLNGLEFLKDYNGKTFDDLPFAMQRRFYEAHITAYIIKPGTPKKVKYSIFQRINTGGLFLNAQEIRHALNQDGNAGPFLRDIAATGEFKQIVNISPRRMQDREIILRHMAFRLHHFEEYKPSMKSFLDNAMTEINSKNPAALQRLKSQFIEAIKLSSEIFGQHVFSKTLTTTFQNPTLNRALFEVVTVLLAELTEAPRGNLLKNKNQFLADFRELLEDRVFDKYITSSTAGINAVKERFRRVKQLIERWSEK